MILGECAPAFASAAHGYGGGSVSGAVVANTGAVPSDVIEIEMPTERTGMFDFIIDPNGVIAMSGASLYKKQYGSDVTFGDGKLFFQNVTTSEDGSRHISYSKRSDALIVTNRSNVPLDVTVSLEVDKGGYSFQFADTSDFKDANGGDINGDAIYMALISSKRSSSVQPVLVENEDGGTATKYAAELHAWIAPPDDAYELAVTNTGAYYYKIKDGTPDSAFHSASFYLTGALNDGSWNGIGEEIDFSVNWDIQKLASDSDVNPYPVPDTDPTVSVSSGAIVVGDTVKFTVDFGSGSGSMPHLDGIRFVKADESEGFISAEDITLVWLDAYEAVATVTATADAVYGSEWAVKLSNDDGATALLPIEFLAPDDGSTDPVVTVTTPVRVSGGTATLSVDWGSGRKAMSSVKELAYKKASGAAATISGTSSSITVTGNTIKIKLASTPFKGSDFVLILTNDDGGIFEAPVELVDTTPSPTSTPTPTPSPSPSPSPSPTPVTKPDDSDGAPNITISKGASASGESVALTLDLGGETDLQVKEMLYVMSGKSADTTVNLGSNLKVANGVVTVKATTAVFNGSDWRLVLTNETGSKTTVIPFDLKKAGTAYGATVDVTTSAASAGSYATVSVDMTDSSYTTIQGMTYMMSGKVTFTTVSSSNLTITDNSVRIKATTAIFNGSNWRIIVSDGDSNTLEIPFELK